MRKGKLEVITGPMFSGKTEELFRRIRRAGHANLKHQLFYSAYDTRDAPNTVSTHNHQSLPGIPVYTGVGMYSMLDPDADLYCTNEGQLFEDLCFVDVCLDLANSGKYVIVTGLDMDSDMKPFGHMGDLMALADQITKLTAICVVCGGDATLSYRKDQTDKKKVKIGGKDAYAPMCRTDYIAARESCFAVKA